MRPVENVKLHAVCEEVKLRHWRNACSALSPQRNGGMGHRAGNVIVPSTQAYTNLTS
jgi:hypothetical protein